VFFRKRFGEIGTSMQPSESLNNVASLLSAPLLKALPLPQVWTFQNCI
jgi:hypothetical protein